MSPRTLKAPTSNTGSGRTIMPQFHAAFSGGAFLGALVGAGLSSLGVGLPEHLLVIAVAVAVLTTVAPRYFLPHMPRAALRRWLTRHGPGPDPPGGTAARC